LPWSSSTPALGAVTQIKAFIEGTDR
jgi:hypothetical protein